MGGYIFCDPLEIPTPYCLVVVGGQQPESLDTPWSEICYNRTDGLLKVSYDDGNNRLRMP